MTAQMLKRVFTDPRYLVVALISALAVFIFATWLPNLGLVWQIIRSVSVPLADKLQILAALVGSIETNFTLFSALSTIAIAVLFGTNVAMVAYYLNLRRHFIGEGGQTGAATSLGGLASGLFGVGCAACGTLVLGPLLSLVGAGGLIALLPFGGQEFSVLGIGILGFSLYLTGRTVGKSLACPVGAHSETGLREAGNH